MAAAVWVPAAALHAQQNVPATDAVTASPAVGAGYGNLPLSFEANTGQSDPQVRFLSRGIGYGLFLTDSEAVLELRKGGCVPLASPTARLSHASAPVKAAPCRPETSVVRMQLGGRSATAGSPAGVEMLPGKANYLIGHDASKWHTGADTFGKVRYPGVYPGVDLVYYGNQQQLEYDFVVAPQANPGQIRLRFAGSRRLRVDAKGDLIVAAGTGQLTFHKPVIYQERDGQRQHVEGQFSLLHGHEVGFRLSAYDHTLPLVIDPVLVYSTYLGGYNTFYNYDPADGLDFANAIVADAQGNAYIAGETFSSQFPTTAGAFQTTDHTPGLTYSGGANAFVIKLNPRGTAPVFSTYLGGSGGKGGAGFIAHGDTATGLAIDSAGNVYVAGSTDSTDFPVTSGAFQTNITAAAATPAGCGIVQSRPTNAFISKLNPSGSALVYSTYLGGSGHYNNTGAVYVGGPNYCGASGDAPVGIAIDPAGNAFVAGSTNSTDFPTTPGAFESAPHALAAVPSGCPSSVTVPAYAGGFATKLNATGTALLYSTYLGGSGRWTIDTTTSPGITLCALNHDYFQFMALDPAGSLYVAGTGESPDLTTPGAFQTVNPSTYGNGSPFVAKLNPTGSALVYSTFLGGNSPKYSYDTPGGLTVDGNGNAYLVGTASSLDFPITPGAFQTVNHAPAVPGGLGQTGFLAKLNTAGTALVYSTYLGGTGTDSVNAVAVDSAGNSYVTGSTSSTDFPVSSGACQTTNPTLANPSAANYTAFVSKLNPTGSALLYSSYLGGSGETPNSALAPSDEGTAIAVDSSNTIFIAGTTGSIDFPTTPGAFEATAPVGSAGYFSSSAFVIRLDPNGKVNPTLAVTPTTSAITTAQSLGLTVNVSAVNGCSPGKTVVPTGSVTLTSGSYTSSAITLSGGSASFTIPAGSLAVGSDTITATYTPDTTSAVNIASGSATATASVTSVGIVPAVTVTPTTNSITTAQTLSVSVAVAGTSGKPTPTGTVTLSATGYTSAPVTLSAGAASFVVPAGALPLGMDSLTATYTPDAASAATYATALGSAVVTVTAAPITVNVTTMPAGLAFSVDGVVYTSAQALSWTPGSTHTLAVSSPQTSAGTQSTFVSWSDAGAASHSVTAPNAATTYTASFSTAYQLTTAANPSSGGTVSPASGTFYPAGTAVPLQAMASAGYNFSNWTGNVASASSAATTVTINAPTSVTANFALPAPPTATLTPSTLSFSAVLGATSPAQTATLTNTGTTTLAISTITVGGTNASAFASTTTCGATLAPGATCSIAVTFSAAATSTYAATLNVADNATGSPQSISLSGTGTPAPSFTLSSPGAAQTTHLGGTAQYSILATAQNGTYNGQVALSVSGLPAGATASFAPATLTPGSSSATSVLTIQVPTTLASASRPGSPWPMGVPSVAVLLMVLFPGRLRRRRIAQALLFLMAIAGLGSLTGCGAGFAISSPRTYPLTVTGTSNTVQQTTTVQLTVQ